jgi:anti-sigma factor RsiW
VSHARTVKTALAAVLVLAVASVAGWWWQRERAGKQEELAQVLVATHIHYLHVPDALEISSADPAIITHWFRDRVPFPVRIPQLNDVHLLGGRVCPLLGQQAALVFYECEGKRLSLFTLAGEATLSEEKRQVTNWDTPRCLKSFEQYRLCFFRSDRVILAIVTEGSEMEEIVTNLFRSLAE